MEWELVEEFLKMLVRRNYVRTTVAEYETTIRKFADYLNGEEYRSFFQATTELCEAYLSEIAQSCSVNYMLKIRQMVYAFYAWLETNGYILINPWSPAKKKHLRHLPGYVPTRDELKQLYEKLSHSDRIDWQRNLVIFDIAYCCGLRRSELRFLDINDIDMNGKTVRVKGKGSKMRLVPIGERSLELLKTYIAHIRPRFLKRGSTNALFISSVGGGQRLGGRSYNMIFEKIRKRYGFKQPMAPHRLRHAFATHLLQNGASVVDVSKMLGHARIKTTQVYTKLAITDLKKHHKAFHPRS